MLVIIAKTTFGAIILVFAYLFYRLIKEFNEKPSEDQETINDNYHD